MKISTKASAGRCFASQADYVLSCRTDVRIEGVAHIGANGNAIETRVFGTDALSSSKYRGVMTTGIRDRL
ncbi:hypothetical protein [Paraburkholderia lacunae]|uniref:Uncharacterized protein n=1 Tax=Paraburkholderia lacunae TaxID=2211104 RepID=A0A370NF80_9BURK|nr:hypothetical protein [Paraburkholderia lacunae]RDK04272.1 hypothetical protein DLM46_04715 [Paraburkholderia lacunae]